MAKRTSTKSPSSSRKTAKSKPMSPALMGVVFVVLVVLAITYWATGADPLGIFNQTQAPTAASTGNTSVGSGGTWWTVYFTDPHNHGDANVIAGSIEEKLIERIQQAKNSIHIASFEFNLTPVAEALVAAHERGVEVQWVTDDEHGLEADTEKGHGQFALLKKAGIKVMDDSRGALMHNKFWIFDGQTVWTGATNITVNGIFENNNNVIVIESPAVAEMYEREFSEMWDDHKFGPTSPSTVEQQTATVEGTPIQVLFASEDEAISYIIPLIQNAKKSIRFMAFSFTYEALGQAVLERAKAGVDVMGIFETRGSETESSQLPALYCAKVAVRQDTNPTSFHHKVFVIDEQILVTGSLNFSNNADDSNDENVVILTNPDIAAPFVQEFNQRWEESVDPKASDMNCK